MAAWYYIMVFVCNSSDFSWDVWTVKSVSWVSVRWIAQGVRKQNIVKCVPELLTDTQEIMKTVST